MAAAGSAACSAARGPTAAEVQAGAQKGLQRTSLTIHSSTGAHKFDVDVAATADEQETGLMFRHVLQPDEGMIFPYDPPASVAFWMKNTLIPLDIIFIRADGSIARISAAKALDLTPVPSGEPIGAVLEIRGGRAAELGIREGDKVDWRH